MSNLYPFKFKTIFKDKIWGGDKIKTLLHKDFAPLPNCGETWEISGVKGNVSVVSNGFLMQKTLPELIATFKSDLLGSKVYEKFGEEFPLLIKFIDANDDLSIQVHPDDNLAQERHNSFGKTEMWYILQADEQARLNAGFNQPVNEAMYLQHLQNNTLDQILNFENVSAGDVFFLPAGRVHYIGKGVCLAEIQQTSDITYRIYDFDRKDDQGNTRELHTEQALAAIDYHFYDNYKTQYEQKQNESATLVKCQYFTTNLLNLDKNLLRDYINIDSFVIFIALEGATVLEYEQGNVTMEKGECILVPACLKHFNLKPHATAKLLEVYIE